MAWTVEELSESKPLPLLKLEKDHPVRIRILSPQVAAAIPADSLYAKGTWDKSKHFPPDDVKAVIGARPVDCIGIRNGCIFHEGLLSWDTTYDNLINVVVYDGVNAKEKTYTESFILGFNMRLSLWKSMGEQLSMLGLEKNQLWAIDWIIVKTGEGQFNTKYNCTAISDTLDQEINLLEFPAQEEYGDTDLPMLVDFRKFYLNPLTTPQQQEEWYNSAQTKAALKSASENVGTHNTALPQSKVMSLPTSAGLPSVPPGLRNVTPVAVPAVQQITMQSGEKKRGRPPKNAIPVEELHSTITQAPVIIPMSGLKVSPTIGKINQMPVPVVKPNVRVAYDAACALVDPWGVDLLHSEYLQFIAEATTEQLGEYSLTAELVAGAQLVLAGPPVEAIVKPVLPGLPKLPGQVMPTPTAVVVPVGSAVSDLDASRAELTKILMSLPVFKSPANIMQFLKLFFPDGTIRTVRQINDVEHLKQIIEFASQGNDAVTQAIGL